MPGFLLHEGAQVVCLHQGQAEPSVPCRRVTVDGKPVTTRDTAFYRISGCTMPPPPNGNGPCVTAQWITAATRVRACGEPVLLYDSQATCTPTGTGVIVYFTQQRVRGI